MSYTGKVKNGVVVLPPEAMNVAASNTTPRKPYRESVGVVQQPLKRLLTYEASEYKSPRLARQTGTPG